MSEYRGLYPSTYESVGRARLAVIQFAACRGIIGDSLNDIESAIGEALANAAEHGHADGGTIVVQASLADGLFIVDIKDSGGGFEGQMSRLAERKVGESLRGFGMFIMRELMDVVEYSERGSRIKLMKRIEPIQSASIDSVSIEA